jgi:ketosteroid isomerase-like protein
MAERNATLIRRGYEAFNAADIETLRTLFDENAVWHTPGRGPLAGDFQGREAIFGHFGRYAAQTGGTFTAALRDVLDGDADGRVAGIHHNTAERNGKRLDVDCCIVFEIENGRLVDGREHFSDSTPGTSSGRSETRAKRRPA